MVSDPLRSWILGSWDPGILGSWDPGIQGPQNDVIMTPFRSLHITTVSGCVPFNDPIITVSPPNGDNEVMRIRGV